MVSKSPKRILMVIRRVVPAALRRRRAALSTRNCRVSSMHSGSKTSSAKVVSWPIPLRSCSVSTARLSIPRARNCVSKAWLPRRVSTSCSGIRWRSPKVNTLAAWNRGSDFGPMPHMRSMPIGASQLARSVESSSGASVMPSGLFMSLASLATNLFGPTPTLTVSPSSARVAARMARAMVTPSPCSNRLPVTSRNASSTLNASSSGE